MLTYLIEVINWLTLPDWIIRPVYTPNPIRTKWTEFVDHRSNFLF
ncbi:hypothetical protein [Spirosoma terrae]|nr:hypothetical protein [Spirosoma terrae]